MVFFRAIYTRRVKIYYGICWLKKELSMVHGTLQILFGNKTFFLVKIESWNFQQLFDLEFHETLQNFSSFRQTFGWYFCMGIKELSKLAVRFHETVNQRNAENFSFLSWKTKSFIPQKNWIYFSQKMATWCPSFPYPRLWYFYHCKPRKFSDEKIVHKYMKTIVFTMNANGPRMRHIIYYVQWAKIIFGV